MKQRIISMSVYRDKQRILGLLSQGIKIGLAKLNKLQNVVLELNMMHRDMNPYSLIKRKTVLISYLRTLLKST